MASAWMDNINRLAAWRSASLSSAVWRLCQIKSNVHVYYLFCFFSSGEILIGGAVQFSNQSSFEKEEGNTDNIWNNGERAASSLLIIIC
jgi:hypothetical protein